MRRWLLLILMLFAPCLVAAQTTSVSGTFIDTGGVAWKNGTYSFIFTPSPNNPTANYFQNGVPFNKNTTIAGSLDGTGSLTSVAVPDNLTIVPSGNTWAFQICPAATATCYRLQLTITGASQSITSAVVPPAIVVNAINPGFYAAYTDGEIVGARQGTVYLNLTDATQHICNLPLCTWLSLASPSSILGLNNNWTGTNTDSAVHVFNGGLTSTTGTFTGALNATAGQNIFNAYNLNNIVWIDGCISAVTSPKYACTGAGIAAALASLPLANTGGAGGGGFVCIPGPKIVPLTSTLVLSNFDLHLLACGGQVILQAQGGFSGTDVVRMDASASTWLFTGRNEVGGITADCNSQFLNGWHFQDLQDNGGGSAGAALYAHDGGSVNCKGKDTLVDVNKTTINSYLRFLGWTGRAALVKTDVGFSLNDTENSTVDAKEYGTTNLSMTISTCTESVNTITCNGTNTFTNGQPVVITGNSLSGYNIVCTMTTVTGSTFQCADPTSGLGTGNGGTATQGNIGPGYECRGCTRVKFDNFSASIWTLGLNVRDSVPTSRVSDRNWFLSWTSEQNVTAGTFTGANSGQSSLRNEIHTPRYVNPVGAGLTIDFSAQNQIFGDDAASITFTANSNLNYALLNHTGTFPADSGTNNLLMENLSGAFFNLYKGIISGTCFQAAGATDNSVSRTAASTIGIGNGTCGDTSGTLQAATLQISGTLKNIANTATMGLTLKKGSGAGNYTTASTSYVAVDSTNLCYTVTIPVGWKLDIQASGALGTSTAVVQALVAIGDNTSCSTATTADIQTQAFGNAAGNAEPFSLSWVINGDGNSHNVALLFATTNAADSALLLNTSVSFTPTMVFTLMPSN